MDEAGWGRIAAGMIFVVFGIFTALFPGPSARLSARYQRGVRRVLPWAYRPERYARFISEEKTWRVINRGLGVFFVFLGAAIALDLV